MENEQGERGWQSCEVRAEYGIGLWKVIRKDWMLFSNRVSFSMGAW